MLYLTAFKKKIFLSFTVIILNRSERSVMEYEHALQRHKVKTVMQPDLRVKCINYVPYFP